jgi:hypothetical protein
MTELVSRARRLSREMAPVVDIDPAVQRQPAGDIDACASQTVKLARAVRHQTNPGAAKHLQHAHRDPVVAFIIVEAKNAVGVDCVESCILQLISSTLVGQAEAATFLHKVKHDAPAPVDTTGIPRAMASASAIHYSRRKHKDVRMPKTVR